MANTKPECDFCFKRENGTHGEIKPEWSYEWGMYITVCRKHFAGFAPRQQATNESKPA